MFKREDKYRVRVKVNCGIISKVVTASLKKILFVLSTDVLFVQDRRKQIF